MQESTARINIRVTEEFKERVAEAASNKSQKLTDFVINALEAAMSQIDTQKTANISTTHTQATPSVMEQLVITLSKNMDSLTTDVKNLQEKLSA